MEYQDFIYEDKRIIEEILKSDDREKKISVLVGMISGVDDWFWLQEKLLEFISDDDFWIAKNAIVGLSDVVRIHKKLDKDKVIRKLRSLNNNSLNGIIENVIDDIIIFFET